jgi:polysaccharide export outer membrane protein
MVTVALALAALLGCAGSGMPHPPEPPPMEKSEYLIGAGDVLAIRVWKNPDLSVEVPVRPDGKLSVPLLDDVQAEGLTALELKEVITRDLSEYISNPDVTVAVQGIGSKYVFVLGEVVRSGPVPLTKDVRVLDALTTAGGFGPFADKKRVKVIRRQGGGEVEYRFNYDAYVAGKAPGTNLLLVPGDAIVVPD